MKIDLGVNPIPLLLEEQSRKRAEQIAILGIDRRPLTYRDLFKTVTKIVTTLNELGIGRQDRVAIVLPNGPEMAVAFLGVASCATSAPLNPNYQVPEFEFYLSDLKAKAIIIATELQSAARSVARQQNIPIIELSLSGETAGIFTLEAEKIGKVSYPGYAETDDVALVLHTSGTTSRPKIVPLTHRNILNSADNICSTLHLTETDCCLNVMVLFHIHGLIAALMTSLRAGSSVVCTPGFLAPRFFEWMQKFQPTWYTAVPTIHQSILERANSNQAIIDQLKLRFIRSSSSSLAPSVMAKLEKTFNAPVIEAYGMTEASHQMTSNPLPPLERKPGTVGLAAGPEVRIMDENNSNLLPIGQQGEIVIRGANVTLGYASNPEANVKSFTDGWFRTGDQGFFDRDGYLTISGRLKEIINRGGEKILPRQVDEVLLEHPAVAQAVTFGIPNPVLGEEVGAAVVLREENVTVRELQQFVATRLSSFKVPHQMAIVDSIPKGATGKLQRIGLWEKLGLQASESLFSDLSNRVTEFVAPQTETEKQLVRVWCEVLNVPQISVNQNFFESGGDSMTAAQLISQIERTFALRLSVTDLFDARTIQEQAVVIERLMASQRKGTQNLSDSGFKSLRLLKTGSQVEPILFFIPGGGGGEEEFLVYGRLLHLLGASQTVYGFFGRGQDGETQPHETVAEMVEDYLLELRELQPQGPYYLSGECVGGKVAYEMACCLDREGERVFLLLLNTRLPNLTEQGTPRAGNYWVERAKYHWRQIQNQSNRERVSYLVKTFKDSPLNPAVVFGANFKRDRQILRARSRYNQLLQDRVPTMRYKQSVSLIVSEDYYAQTPTMGVTQWIDNEVKIYPTQGNYNSYLGIHLETTAQQIRHLLHLNGNSK
ncbi:MAG: AMP-binding protein [Oscillatoria sp. PMC 1051.18]|nr:AMP-binding protein [Oscillatoria sp. PMC 1050.18]MEC5031527.1 AMP-binding protein [Oscillatoria sp. PMC 1051.18]